MTAASWTVESRGSGVVGVLVVGEFDVAVEQRFVGEVAQHLADGGRVEVDLSGVEFMDSTGVRALMLLRDRHGKAVSVGEMSEPVRRLFATVGVLEWLTG